jgi:hypothetical protein
MGGVVFLIIETEGYSHIMRTQQPSAQGDIASI